MTVMTDRFFETNISNKFLQKKNTRDVFKPKPIGKIRSEHSFYSDYTCDTL